MEMHKELIIPFYLCFIVTFLLFCGKIFHEILNPVSLKNLQSFILQSSVDLSWLLLFKCLLPDTFFIHLYNSSQSRLTKNLQVKLLLINRQNLSDFLYLENDLPEKFTSFIKYNHPVVNHLRIS